MAVATTQKFLKSIKGTFTETDQTVGIHGTQALNMRLTKTHLVLLKKPIAPRVSSENRCAQQELYREAEYVWDILTPRQKSCFEWWRQYTNYSGDHWYITTYTYFMHLYLTRNWFEVNKCFP